MALMASVFLVLSSSTTSESTKSSRFHAVFSDAIRVVCFFHVQRNAVIQGAECGRHPVDGRYTSDLQFSMLVFKNIQLYRRTNIESIDVRVNTLVIGIDLTFYIGDAFDHFAQRNKCFIHLFGFFYLSTAVSITFSLKSIPKPWNEYSENSLPDSSFSSLSQASL